MSDTAHLLKDMAATLFERACDKSVRKDAEAGVWPQALWMAVEEAGLTRALVPETAGGSGLGIADAMVALQISARCAAPIPLAETMLASWLLSGAGLPIPDGALTIAPACGQDALALTKQGANWRLQGQASRIPFARHAAGIAVLAQWEGKNFIGLVSPAQCTLKPGHNLAREPRDNVMFDCVVSAADVAPALSDRNAATLHAFGAAMRTIQIAGALDHILDMTCDYVQTRVQFGKPLAKFQAVQQSLAMLGAQSAAANVAADMATEGAARNFDALLIGAAKTRAGEAASIGAAIAHQAHGAMGFTQDYDLHYFTKRLWSWRDEFGRENDWALTLGRAAALAGPGGLWSKIIAA